VGESLQRLEKGGSAGMNLTDSQKTALSARGNVLVVAGAGTGKTRTLVERCCALVLNGDCSLDEILMVTFTDAAAAEMRRRIRSQWLKKLETEADPRLEEQFALLETAHISTLHSFCLKLIRRHFHHEQLQLDPEFTMLTQEQTHQLGHQTLDELLDAQYADNSPKGETFRRLVKQSRAGEKHVRDLIWRLHRHAQSLADPEGWFELQSAMFSADEPAQWRQWLVSGFREWTGTWLDVLQAQAPDNTPAHRCAEALKLKDGDLCSGDIQNILETIAAADAAWPTGRKTAFRKPIEKCFSDAQFFASLMPTANGDEPLAQDWQWCRALMRLLVQLAREFGAAFARAKREAGGIDFSDLEQLALRLLWDAKAGGPTPVAREWRARLKFVFVDEYQDINAAQDMILRALSRDGEEANRFLVGDVKQSIYRFRLANPAIFQNYKKAWQNGVGRVIPLSHNFRSREALLDFVNPLFAALMREEVGGVTYDDDARLQFGAPQTRQPLSRAADRAPAVEIHLRVKGTDDDDERPEHPAQAELADLESAEKEARLAALRLRELRANQQPVWDEELHVFRPVEWRDMVLLLRAPGRKVEAYAKEFSRLGVPLNAERSGFYDASEISDLLSLLQLLDNPLQDLPLLAVLRSPLAAFSLDELAVIRAARRQCGFWAAMQQFAREQRAPDDAGEIAKAAQGKTRAFLASFERWRRLTRQAALSDCLEQILAETHCEALLLAQERGQERVANVRRLLKLARQFDPYQRQGLFRFLKFVDAQRDARAEEEPAAPPVADAVRLMSIHRSKGLEFPVVVVADLGKSFNLSDLRADILLDPEYGLCPRITPPGGSGHYPSLPYWLANRRQRAESLGEELRLFYVALTRAKDRLLLTGTSRKGDIETWREGGKVPISTRAILSAQNCASWLQLWLPHAADPDDWTGDWSGENTLAKWTLYSENDERLGLPDSPAEANPANGAASGETVSDEFLQRLTWQYPFARGTIQPAKTSVTALRRQVADEDAWEPFAQHARKAVRATVELAPGGTSGARKLSAADIGTAHHTFLQFVSLDRAGSIAELEAESRRLEQEHAVSSAERAALDLEALAAFFASEPGRGIREKAGHVLRELPFTARFSPKEVMELLGRMPEDALPDEFLVVQGFADLVVLLPGEIWLLDFKTDRFKAGELGEKLKTYEPQLKLYALALSRIYQRPVSQCWLHFLTLRRSVAVNL
jgi:ATP-dependent helicase/nuclease subunit A